MILPQAVKLDQQRPDELLRVKDVIREDEPLTSWLPFFDHSGRGSTVRTVRGAGAARQ